MPPFYPGLAASLWLGALANLPAARAGRARWAPPLATEGAELAARLAAVEPQALVRALGAEARTRFDEFLTGIESYRIHPHRRAATEWPVRWQRGTTALREHYPSVRGRPVLIVPSLINRSSILDLAPERSLTRLLAARGLRPLVVDWGEPGAAECAFSLTDYVVCRLEPALAAARHMAGGPVSVVGYCMGGLLALALAQRRRESVSGLALLATPWDFHAADAGWTALLPVLETCLSARIEREGVLPAGALQALFAIAQPERIAAKFRVFATLAPDDPAAVAFVEVEDWINDGIPLAGAVARECLFDWYGRNATAGGRWSIGGAAVDPAAVSLPALVFVPARDRIVPPESAAALAAALPCARRLQPRSGHIGMVVGRQAQGECFRPLADWLLAVAK